MAAPTEHFCDWKWSPKRPIEGLTGGWNLLSPGWYWTDSGKSEDVPAEGKISICWVGLHPGQALPGAAGQLAETSLLLWNTSVTEATESPPSGPVRCEALMRLAADDGPKVATTGAQTGPGMSAGSSKKKLPGAIRQYSTWGLGGIVLLGAADLFAFLGVRHAKSNVPLKATGKSRFEAGLEVVLYYKNGPYVSEKIIGSESDPNPQFGKWVYLGVRIEGNGGAATIVRAQYCVSKLDKPDKYGDYQDWRPKKAEGVGKLKEIEQASAAAIETQLSISSVRAGLGCFLEDADTVNTAHFARFHLFEPKPPAPTT